MGTWNLTSFDLFSLGMTIKGAWIYKELPAASALQASLDAVLRPYPQLLGRYDEKQKSVLWSGQEEPVKLVELDRSGHSVSEDMYALVPKFDTGAFKSGKSRAFEGADAGPGSGTRMEQDRVQIDFQDAVQYDHDETHQGNLHFGGQPG